MAYPGRPPARTTVTTVARLFRAPDEAWLPDDVRGRRLVVVDGALIEDLDQGERLFAPLRALKPEIDTFGVVPASSLARMHLDPEAPTAVYANSVLVDDLPGPAIEALVAAAGPDSASALLFVEIRHLGGALSRPAPRPGVLEQHDGGVPRAGRRDRRGCRMAIGPRRDQPRDERPPRPGTAARRTC